MGLFAPPAAYLGARIGTRAAIALSVLLIGAFGVARAIAPSAAFVVLFTWPIGVGMGLAGALVPVAVKENFPVRPAGPTGVYTTGVQLGSALSAAIAVPIAAVVRGMARLPCRLLTRDDRVGGRMASLDTAGARPRTPDRRARRGSPGIAASLGSWSRSFH